MKKRRIAALLCGVMILSLLGGCTAPESNETATAKEASEEPSEETKGTEGEAKEAAPATDYDVLKVAMMPFGGNVPAQYAYDQGYFEELGLNIEFYQFANGAGINEALAAGEVDVGVSGLAMIFSLASGTCQMIAESNTSGGMGIYVNPDSDILNTSQEINGSTVYGSPETVKGITVIGQTGTSSQYNLAGWLKCLGLTEADVEFANVALGSDVTAFVAGEGEAIAASRPYSFQLEADGYVLAGGFDETTDTTLVDCIVARNEVVEARREELVLFLKGYFKALEEIAADEDLRFDESMKYFADQGREYSENDMRNEMKVNKYVTKEYMSSEDYVYGDAMVSIGDFYCECGQIEEDNLPNIPASFNAELLEEALGISVKVRE